MVEHNNDPSFKAETYTISRPDHASHALLIDDGCTDTIAL